MIGLTEVFLIPENLNVNIESYHPLNTKTRPGENDNRGGVGL
jgi:hypothetical protein